jgi:hypothetical protein
MNTLILLHSVTRYLVLIGLLGVILQSLVGLTQNKPYGKLENKAGLYLFIFTHTQLLLGIILYFMSPVGISNFSGAAMKDAATRYWLVEHNTIMLIAIVLITLARTTSKKMTTDSSKHKRLLIFNSIALGLIILGIAMSGRGFFNLPS